jgi:CMP-N-acetylneuraminic acid synthetase
MVIGIITARGGSKGLQGKNMVDLGGRPLIEHTFVTAQQCASLKRIFLSTDILEAITLARARFPRIEVPYVRPPALCTDRASLVDVVSHLLEHLKLKEDFEPEAIMLLQPTSPFRRVTEIEDAIRTFRECDCESMLGVTRALHHPADYIYRSSCADTQFTWVMRAPEWRCRQDFPDVYFNTGALYMCRTKYLLTNRRFYDEGSRLFQMAEESALDIDTPFDLRLARGWWNEMSSDDSPR